jgi:hypothetical protein
VSHFGAIAKFTEQHTYAPYLAHMGLETGSPGAVASGGRAIPGRDLCLGGAILKVETGAT